MPEFPDFTRTSNLASILRRARRMLSLAQTDDQLRYLGADSDAIKQAICDMANEVERRMFNDLPQTSREVQELAVPANSTQVSLALDIRDRDVLAAYWLNAKPGVDPKLYIVPFREIEAKNPQWRLGIVKRDYPVAAAIVDWLGTGDFPALVFSEQCQQPQTIQMVTRPTIENNGYIPEDLESDSTVFSQIPDPLIETEAMFLAAEMAASIQGRASVSAAALMTAGNEKMLYWAQRFEAYPALMATDRAARPGEWMPDGNRYRYGYSY